VRRGPSGSKKKEVNSRLGKSSSKKGGGREEGILKDWKGKRRIYEGEKKKPGFALLKGQESDTTEND